MADSIKSFYEDEFYGMDRRLDYDKLPTGMSPLAVNVDLDRIGTVRKRKGTRLLGDAGIVDATVQNIIEYTNQNGNKEIRMIRNGSMYKYNATTQLWDVTVSGVFSSLKPVASVNYNNRMYFISPDEYLSYSEGTNSLTTVGTDTDRIRGACLGVGQRTLFVGNVTVNGVYYANRVYFSLFDIEENKSTDQLWNNDEGNLLDSKRYFEVEGGNVQAIVSFYARNLVYIFSDTKCYTFSISKVESAPGSALVEVFDIGCAGPRAATVVDGVMYWIDKKGTIWAWSGNTLRPTEMSYPIDDENLGESLISLIDKSPENLSLISAFGLGKKIYFSIGSISLDGVVLPNACIKITLSQNGLEGYYSVDTYPDRLYLGYPVSLDSQIVLLAGDSANILVLNSAQNDIGYNTNLQIEEFPINGIYRTQSYAFNAPFNVKEPSNLLVRFRPQPQPETYLNVSVAVNNAIEFKELSNVQLNKVRHGKIDMYDVKFETLKHKIAELKLSNEYKFYTIAFEFNNNELNQSFEISAFGFERMTIRANTNLPS